jgi:hypothetical protein
MYTSGKKLDSRAISQVILALFFLGMALPLRAQVSSAVQQVSPPKERSGWNIVANHDVAAMLTSGGTEERITGRVSVFLKATPAAMREWYVEALGFNVVFTGVSQATLGETSPSKHELGVLGFALQSGKSQRLRYDPKSGRIDGQLRMYMDASWLSKFAQPAADGRNDLFLTPTVPVSASVEVLLDKPLQDRADELARVPGSLNLSLKSEKATFDKVEIPPLAVSFVKPAVFEWELAPIYFFELAQRLCVQPVQLLRFSWFSWWPFVQYSGAGLAFGEPGARTEWRKNDVTFEIRDWMTIWSGNHWELDEGEASDLRAEVDVDDCIEVFFVNSLDPDDQWGGGATWGSGTAGSKVISSDDNARNGVDFTHLAHELGHVLGLIHPGQTPSTSSTQAASTGTLMCPSGYRNDNPQVNSQENQNLLSNPLLQFGLKVWSPGPDCTDSADCGACP